MNLDRRVRTSFIAIAADLLLIGTKGALAVMTGSLAIAADAWHSFADLVVSVVVLAGIGLRLREERRAPAALAGLVPVASGGSVPAGVSGEPAAPRAGNRVEAGIAYAVAVAILYVPYEIATGLREAAVHEIRRPGLALGGMLLCAAIAFLAARLKLTVGRETGSAGLSADGFHSWSDMLGTLAVIAAILGQLAGVALEPIAAVLIAVLIGATGLELMVVSGEALLFGTPMRHGAGEAWLKERTRRARDCLRVLAPEAVPGPPRRLIVATLAGLAVLLWLATGLTAVGPSELGVRTRFGAVVGPPLEPGLHLVAPWPVDLVRRVELGSLRRSEIGFRSEPGASVRAALLWDGGDPPGYRRVPEESLALAGDENLVHASLVVHWRPTDPGRALFAVNRLDEVVVRLAESAFHEVMATEPLEGILASGRERILERTRSLLAREAGRLDLGIEVVSVLLQELRPPLEVAPAFRDVFSAREDHLRLLSLAEAHQNQALPEARGRAAMSGADAAASRAERRLRAEGDALHFAQVAGAFASHREVTGLRLHAETAEVALSGRKKIIADPRANRGGYHLWLFAPERPPPPLGPEPRHVEFPE